MFRCGTMRSQPSQTKTRDFTTIFDIYMRPHSRRPLEWDGIEFRYAAASLLIACSKSDLDQDPGERRVITEILEETFSISKKTVDRLLEFADAASEGTYLKEITALINEQFNDRDAGEISLSSDDVETAHTFAQHQLN
jgi:uncharacterized tellurite resistance protein B-like protein